MFTDSRSSGIATIAPKNGAIEKYAAVRAVPRERSAVTNNAKLNRRTGPTIPPARIAPQSHGQVPAGNRTFRARRNRRYSVSPTPEPA